MGLGSILKTAAVTGLAAMMLTGAPNQASASEGLELSLPSIGSYGPSATQFQGFHLKKWKKEKKEEETYDETVAEETSSEDTASPEERDKEVGLAIGYGVGIYGEGFSHGGVGRFSLAQKDGYFLSAALGIGYDPGNERLTVHPQLGGGMYFPGSSKGRIGFAAYPLGFAVVGGETAYLISLGFQFEILTDKEVGFYIFPNAGMMFGSEKLLGDDNFGGYGALEAGVVGHF